MSADMSALILVAAAAPLAVLLAVTFRLRAVGTSTTGLGRALVAGGIIGPAVAILTHGIVAALAGSMVVGLADSGAHLLDQFRADPTLSDVLRSPWVLVLLIDVVVVAPLTEEVAKALGALTGRPGDRRAALLAGVAAGTGFAIVEDIVYGAGAASFGGSWVPLVVARAMGAAVHPLATGLVMLGWWDWRHNRDAAALARGYFGGVGVHALWNGAQVAMLVAMVATENTNAGRTLLAASLAFTGAFGLMAMGGLWSLTRRVAAGGHGLLPSLEEPRAMAAWMILAAAMLAPVAFIAIAYPEFIAL